MSGTLCLIIKYLEEQFPWQLLIIMNWIIDLSHFWSFCNFLVCEGNWEPGRISGWILGLQRTFDFGMHFPPKITFWVLMLGSSYYGFWHICIYLGPARSTCIVAFIFLSLFCFSNIYYLFFESQHALQSDFMMIVKNLSHFDSTLYQVAFRNTLSPLTHCVNIERRHDSPISWDTNMLERLSCLTNPMAETKLHADWLAWLLTFLLSLHARRKDKQGFTRSVNIPYSLR